MGVAHNTCGSACVGVPLLLCRQRQEYRSAFLRRIWIFVEPCGEYDHYSRWFGVRALAGYTPQELRLIVFGTVAVVFLLGIASVLLLANRRPHRRGDELYAEKVRYLMAERTAECAMSEKRARYMLPLLQL